MPRTDAARGLAAAGTMALALVAAIGRPELAAHTPIASRYTYTRDVYPILREHCGACHFPGGPGMSLLSYTEAASRADAIREQLTSEAMPPWFADRTGPGVRGTHVLPADKLDVLMTWASGGTPEGEARPLPEAGGPAAGWPAGEPDHVFALPDLSPPEGTADVQQVFMIATEFRQDTWIRAADILPGDRSVVRAVTVEVAGGEVLAAWVPGEVMTDAPAGTAFRVPAQARLRVTVVYRRARQAGAAIGGDRTRIGLYTTDPPASGGRITALSFDDTLTLRAPVRILAVRTLLHEQLNAVQVTASLPSGEEVPLLLLRAPRPDWNRRYWLVTPVVLPTGATVSVHVSGDNPVTELLAVESPR